MSYDILYIDSERDMGFCNVLVIYQSGLLIRRETQSKRRLRL